MNASGPKVQDTGNNKNEGILYQGKCLVMCVITQREHNNYMVTWPIYTCHVFLPRRNKYQKVKTTTKTPIWWLSCISKFFKFLILNFMHEVVSIPISSLPAHHFKFVKQFVHLQLKRRPLRGVRLLPHSSGGVSYNRTAEIFTQTSNCYFICLVIKLIIFYRVHFLSYQDSIIPFRRSCCSWKQTAQCWLNTLYTLFISVVKKEAIFDYLNW